MRTHNLAAAALVAGTWIPSLAWAQHTRAVEVTPYVAFGSAAASPIGVSVTFPVTATIGIEVDTAYRRGEGNIAALSSSASVLWCPVRIGSSEPYVAGGIGLAQHGAPVFGASGPPIGTRSRLTLSVNAGAGVKTPLNDRVALRTDARWFKLVGQGSDQFRLAQGVSVGFGAR